MAKRTTSGPAKRPASSTKPASSKKPPAKKAAPKKAPPPPEDRARAFAIDAARLLFDDKCTDVIVLDVRGVSQVTDYIVIGTGTSDRQMKSVLQHARELGAASGFPAWRTDIDEGGLWLLLDCAGVVVHLFEPNARAHYDLEMLWGDAPRPEWERPDQQSRDRARLNT